MYSNSTGGVGSRHITALYRALYDIQDRIGHWDPAARRRESVPLMKHIESLIYSPSAMKLLPKSKLGKAVSYMRNNWVALKRFLSDGRLPIDNNEAERALRRCWTPQLAIRWKRGGR